MRVFRFDEIDSTNSFLKRESKLENYDLAMAKNQTEGRGRRGNSWISKEGAALFSFVLKEDSKLPMEEYRKLPLVVGVTVLRALKKFQSLDYKFKWTNDIYVNEKKISGILVEKINENFIIGIGINVNNEDFGDLKNSATSLKIESNREFNIEELIFVVVEEFKNCFGEFLNGGWELILNEINERNYLLDKPVTIKIIDKITRGIGGKVLEDGTLEVNVDGTKKSFDIGEVHISFKDGAVK
ncbi:biotin--[acetyl-CoA-carboxylase] ligase [uncultured Ilyobacter sp.]|uniref:biotin--[acetyl-CoA-carboxylase] ligase n=1 Tax=uncultured Ilyobacter sp. TaxID=544433 RepID=UPI0029F5AA8D|nr:biotin--[acetyl-CoA-carboxylase] ligase [uncultured Ilyobacter sp.]